MRLRVSFHALFAALLALTRTKGHAPDRPDSTCQPLISGPAAQAMLAALTEPPRLRAEREGNTLNLHYSLPTSEGWLTLFQSDQPTARLCDMQVVDFIPLQPGGAQAAPDPAARGRAAQGTYTLAVDPAAPTRFYRALWEPWLSRGRALVFEDGAFDLDAMKASTPDGKITKQTPLIYNKPVEVTLTFLGQYDLEGNWVGPNNDPVFPDQQIGVLMGKYLQTILVSLQTAANPRVFPLKNASNDFRFDYRGDTEKNISPREAILWSSEAQHYYDVTRFRSEIFNDRFIKSHYCPVKNPGKQG